MSNASESPASAADRRRERLAAELRANLRRRKDQAREREAVGTDETPTPDDPSTPSS